MWAAIAFFIKLPERPVLVSPEKEQSIGENYRDMILTLNGFRKVENTYLDSVLHLTAEKLKSSLEESKFQYNISLVDNEMVNAFALPGGYMIVTTGLIDFCEDEQELIAVICHEIGHIEKRHVIARLIKEVGLDLLKSNDPFITGEIARGIVSSGYNRRQEEEADVFACNLLLKNGIEPRTLATVFRKLKEEDKSGLYKQFEILSSYPNLDARIKAVLSFEIPEDFTAQEPWIDWETFKKAAGKLQE